MTDSIGPQTVGDRCFIAYREMLRKWRASPRWATAHEIYKEIHLAKAGRDCSKFTDDTVSVDLAWQVFFHGVVMPYEDLKRIENGQIDY